jgi:hypothetical protein
MQLKDAVYHLRQGHVHPRSPRFLSQAHSGIHPLSPLTHRTQSFQPLPSPLGDPPYHYDLESAVPGITAQAAQNGKLVFHTVGDTGGVKNPNFQADVAHAMVADLHLPPSQAPSFFYLVGDVVYFNGQISDYYGQFYEPYAEYTAPIISIPGNHDGDPINASQTSLDGWVAYFMTAVPHVNPESADAPRVTMSLPNVYFTLNCPFVTIVGMYTNVPEHGSIDSIQQQWLTNEFATAPQDKALVVALHHPIYSFDNYHSGSPNMADAVQHAINDSRRVPNMVLTAHVHNYQRIERPIAGGVSTPFLVAGHGGYYNMHHLNSPSGTTDPATNATLVFGNDTEHGYATLTVSPTQITGTMTLAGSSGRGPVRSADRFAYPAAAQFLPNGIVASL